MPKVPTSKIKDKKESGKSTGEEKDERIKTTKETGHDVFSLHTKKVFRQKWVCEVCNVWSD